MCETRQGEFDVGDGPNSDPISPPDIALAIDAGQMELRLQPIVSATDGTVTRAEGLLRWHHPTAGMIPRSSTIRHVYDARCRLPCFLNSVHSYA